MTLYVAFRVFIIVYLVIDSVRKRLDKPSYAPLRSCFCTAVSFMVGLGNKKLDQISDTAGMAELVVLLW
jgi:hypothetical protein